MVIEQPHNLGLRAARERVEGLMPKLRDRYGLDLSWRGDVASFTGKGFTGTLTVGEARVTIELRLGLLARPFAGKIQAAMQEQMAKVLV